MSEALNISVVIPAAGSSTRMGQTKALLPAKNNTIIENQIDILQTAGLKNIFIVTNEREQFVEVLETYNVQVIKPSHKTKSMIESIRCAMAYFVEKSDGMMIVPSDFPYLSKKLLTRIVLEFRNNFGKIVVPSFHGKRGHPVIIPSRYFDMILKDFGDCGIRGLFDAFPESVTPVEWSDDSVLKNMNTKRDYEDYLNWIEEV